MEMIFKRERNMKIDVCIMEDSIAIRGKWRICQVVEICPDKEVIVRDFKVTDAPPGKLKGSGKYDKGITMMEIKRHVNF